MVLDSQRRNVDPILTFFAKKLSIFSPNTLTWLSLIFAVFAGLFFYLSNRLYELENHFLYFASLFVFLNGFFDAIDGKVAKITKKTSLKGDFLDHALDRYSDVFIIGGLALSSWCRPSIGMLAIIGTLLTSYMGTQAQAVGSKRIYKGLLGRADRLFLLIIMPMVQHLLIYYNIQIPFFISLLEIVMLYFAIVGNLTALQRFYYILKWFNKKK
ncbi:MAG TPA: CDP-alcohol phosphatidyltransferase family protein [Thermoplasmatales archaeon]|nr:CDP-alcohol phosphatidyltransferase family protein [Thermoplasmatales archaeon]HEX08248.1 CDP-alcohol phosphatidyltransferase family protein [Thermoplasmatales archaeon]